MSEELTVELRSQHGKRNARRLRRDGKVPAILYGHGEDNVSLQVSMDDLSRVVRHGSRVVELTGAVRETALVRELQWDTFGNEVLHLDLTRVRTDERVGVEVAVELRGEAPGAKEGGVVEHVLHEVAIECPAASIPEKLVLRVGDLHLNGALTADKIELPEGARLITSADALVVHCVPPAAEEELAPSGEVAEPELIRKEKPEGDEDES